MRYIKGFFAFWYDFIVGDSAEVAVGVVLSLAALFVIVRVARPIANDLGLLLPLAIVGLLGFSLWRVRSLD